MGDHSKIAWTDSTWNVISGCSRVSEGCEHCYAEALSHRYGWTTTPWTAIHAAENVTFHPERVDQPLRWRTPRRIFVNSMSDLWHDQVSDEILDTIWAAMALAPHHTFQILTKRPERMQRYLSDPQTPVRIADRLLQVAHSPNHIRLAASFQQTFPWPLPHVWLGISCETQRWAAMRIPFLLNTPAAIRFLSCEPLLGPIDLSPWAQRTVARLHWVIVGAESGPHARPMEDAWVRPIRDTCQSHDIAFFLSNGPPQGGIRSLEILTFHLGPIAYGHPMLRSIQ